jgi:hypothetical protein
LITPVGGAGVAAYDDAADPANMVPAGELDTVIIDTSGNAATVDVTIYRLDTNEIIASVTNVAVKTTRVPRKAVTLPDGTAIAGASDVIRFTGPTGIRVLVAQGNAVNIPIRFTFK